MTTVSPWGRRIETRRRRADLPIAQLARSAKVGREALGIALRGLPAAAISRIEQALDKLEAP